jgi:hypothetical protein
MPGTRQRWTVGKFFLCRGLGTRQILAVAKGGRRDGPLAFAECPTVWRSAKIFFKILCRVPHDLALGKFFFVFFLPHLEYFKFFSIQLL